MSKLKKAFTLIELLVVIAIIAIIATIAVVALQNSRASARDAKRLADVKQMQTALELYFNDNGSYPTSVTSTIASGSNVYMTLTPVAPTPIDGDCTTTTNAYTYSSDGSTYSISFCLGNHNSGLNAGSKVATRDGISEGASTPAWSCGDVLVDSRDLQEYTTKQFGSQCWMTENINYDDGCSARSWINNTDNRWCGCHGGSASNCNTYGKLYQWSAAMAGSTTAGAQGICPTGWHLPTSAEQTVLVDTINSNVEYRCGGTNGAIGVAVSSSLNWAYNPNYCSPGNNQQTNNSTGFNIMPAGRRDNANGSFFDIGYTTFLWSSSFSSPSVYSRGLNHGYNDFRVYTGEPSWALSVRCIKD